MQFQISPSPFSLPSHRQPASMIFTRSKDRKQEEEVTEPAPATLPVPAISTYQEKKMGISEHLKNLTDEERDYRIRRSKLMITKRVNKHLEKKTGKERRKVDVPPRQFTKNFAWPTPSSRKRVTYTPSGPVVYRITLRNALSEMDAFDDIVCERNFFTKTLPIQKEDLLKVITACDTLKRDCEKLLLLEKGDPSPISNYLSDSSIFSPLLSSDYSTETLEAWSGEDSGDSMDSFITEHDAAY